ncbi:Uncharacterised protein [Serratia quinivorans]|nr:Uncharacterised protein [Serratia quinivorans]CAI1179712.1 Uncharacterised protein [Serratia quinivorans]CAI2155695.1 Uncharacterised protein [Serratia quinivorans]
MLGNGNVQAMYRDIDLQALQDSLDCNIAFHGVGIIFSDGQNSYLVRTTKHTGYSTSSQVTHVVITKTVAHTSRTAATNTLSEALTKPSVGKELIERSGHDLSCHAKSFIA